MQDIQPKNSRRGFFFGAATAGAAAAVVVTIPALRETQAVPAAIKPVPEKGGGYSVSEHVERYYKTARL